MMNWSQLQAPKANLSTLHLPSSFLVEMDPACLMPYLQPGRTENVHSVARIPWSGINRQKIIFSAAFAVDSLTTIMISNSTIKPITPLSVASVTLDFPWTIRLGCISGALGLAYILFGEILRRWSRFQAPRISEK